VPAIRDHDQSRSGNAGGDLTRKIGWRGLIVIADENQRWASDRPDLGRESGRLMMACC